VKRRDCFLHFTLRDWCPREKSAARRLSSEPGEDAQKAWRESRNRSRPAFRASVSATTMGFLPGKQYTRLFFSHSPTNVRQTLPPRSPIVGDRQKAPFAGAAQQKGDAIAKPLCEVKHGYADFLPRAARLPRVTLCFGSRSAARLFFNFHGGFATQGREPRIKICDPALSAADKLKCSQFNQRTQGLPARRRDCRQGR
jgi:hypothetical protein